MDLATQAQSFADELTWTVNAVVPSCPAFASQVVGDRARIRQDPDTGISLNVNGVALLTLKVEYHCCLDGRGVYLAADEAQVKVFAGSKAAGEPLFRYHYLRAGAEDVPAAHIHVHAHRDAFSHVLGRTGEGTARGKRRARGADVPRLSEVHFPVGGHRFRPCLEDVLEMVALEFGVDRPAGALDALRSGRHRWRRRQTQTVVRDDPDAAIVTLRELGYDVCLRDGEASPAGRPERLRQF